ncbi:MAG: phosphoribosylformylglycinamidine cyclo-ligase [Nitrospirota bacterium]|jgi:phosphoribosylformylglycinamidine cyclo-ligase
MPEFTYKKAGVDIEEGERLVDAIAPMVKKTFRPEVLTDIGSFGALFQLDVKKYREPVLVSGTDGVGTKLKVAFMADVHNTVGVDLVAMCVNDILTSGAEPLFFLDYFATGKLSAGRAARVIEGIADGCREAGCSLVGGETAEMPGFYQEGEYDLSGFAVGVVEKKDIVDGSKIAPGDAIIGLCSSGLHSNGYSLVRKIFFDHLGYNVGKFLPELGCTVGEEFLRPTAIYVKAVQELGKSFEIKGMAHITGGGIPGNVPRALPKGTRAVIREGSWSEPPVFKVIRELGGVPEDDMRSTFNMGVGFVIVLDEENSQEALKILDKTGFKSCIIGQVQEGGKGVEYVA